MAIIESTTLIRCPVNQVFEGLLDLENARDFDPEVKSVKMIGEGPIGVGTEFLFYEPTPPFGRLGYTKVTYTAIELNKRIDFIARVGPLSPVGAFEFEPTEKGTRLTFRGTVRPPLLMRLFTPVMRRAAQKTWDKRLAWIKTWMEGKR
ncbi:MAG TPA: SRPBCC family protein [Chryseosolibacter sp.]|nr:SRPBCC family protein [Chryseosolibacter sp.]